jgi:xylose isomerase
MDSFAHALLAADKILTDSPYKSWMKTRYASFDSGMGADYETGKLKLEDLRDFALGLGEPQQISGRQEKFEQLMQMYF